MWEALLEFGAVYWLSLTEMLKLIPLIWTCQGGIPKEICLKCILVIF
jgi:hypothetical protein